MKSTTGQYKGHGAIDLIEQAVHLLRCGSTALLFPWVLGTLPFVLGLLLFWSQMRHSFLAGEKLAEISLFPRAHLPMDEVLARALRLLHPKQHVLQGINRKPSVRDLPGARPSKGH